MIQWVVLGEDRRHSQGAQWLLKRHEKELTVLQRKAGLGVEDPTDEKLRQEHTLRPVCRTPSNRKYTVMSDGCHRESKWQSICL